MERVPPVTQRSDVVVKNPGLRRRRTLIIVVGVGVVVAAGVGVRLMHSPAPKTKPQHDLPVRVVAAPRAVISATAPDQYGESWVLTNSGRAANVQLINVKTGQTTRILPTSLSARAVVDSPGGPLAVGLATSRAGAVVFYGPSGRGTLGTVALPGPVIALAAGTNDVTYYALVTVGSALSVSVIDSTTMRVTGSVPMPKATVAIAVNPSQPQLFALTSDGTTSIVSTVTKQLTERFVTGPLGRALAISPDGARLYVLDGSAKVSNVAVVKLATQSIITRIPAPANCVAIAPTLDDSLLVDFVGTGTYGNIQSFRTGL